MYWDTGRLGMKLVEQDGVLVVRTGHLTCIDHFGRVDSAHHASILFLISFGDAFGCQLLSAGRRTQKGTWADEMKLRIGDELVSINGQAVSQQLCGTMLSGALVK